MGRDVTLADSVKEYWPKLKMILNKAMGQYNTPEAREKVMQSMKKGAEFGMWSCPAFGNVLACLLEWNAFRWTASFYSLEPFFVLRRSLI